MVIFHSYVSLPEGSHDETSCSFHNLSQQTLGISWPCQDTFLSQKNGATTEVQGNGIGVKTPVMTQSSLLLMNPSILPWHKGQTVCSLRMLEVHLQYLILVQPETSLREMGQLGPCMQLYAVFRIKIARSASVIGPAAGSVSTASAT